MSPAWRIGWPLPHALVAAAILAAVVVGGVAIGMVHAFSEEIGLDW